MYDVSCLYLTDIDISTLRKLIRKVLTKYHAALADLLKSSLAKLADEMLAAELISSVAQETPTFDNIIGEFMAGMSFVMTCIELQEYVVKFLEILKKIGANFARAANVLQNEWTEIIKKELKLEIKFTTN